MKTLYQEAQQYHYRILAGEIKTLYYYYNNTIRHINITQHNKDNHDEMLEFYLYQYSIYPLNLLCVVVKKKSMCPYICSTAEHSRAQYIEINIIIL